MGTLDQAYQLENLNRAWRWLRSNPDPVWKAFFRSHYANYAVADTALISNLLDRLKRGIYEPEHACKLFFPKASGIVRPFSLLTVEDQIVYQSLVNVVAEKLYHKVKRRYLKEIFGHLYAGKSSLWFYRKWQDGYAAFNSAARRAHSDGFRIAARFDLTAFYDSLDHGVLTHFLRQFGCDKEFCEFLPRCLNRWTATPSRIYHQHGIPQGPLSSGLLSEVILQYFDRNHRCPSGVKYFRYVDDIRLFSRSEKDLRRVLSRLDILSKDIGLFPQSEKIEIHTVTDIEAELKMISIPFEDVPVDEEGEMIDQDGLRKKIMAICPRGRVENANEFKVLLSLAKPTYRLNNRLWRVLDRHPELHGSVLRYFQRYSKLPRKVGACLLERLKASPIYAAEVASLIRTAEGRLNKKQTKLLDEYVMETWTPKLLRSQLERTEMIAVLGRWGLQRHLFTYDQVEYATRKMREWWVRAEMIGELKPRDYGVPSYQAIIDGAMNDSVADVAIGAAVNLIQKSSIRHNLQNIPKHPAASRVLEAFGLLPDGTTRVCGITDSFARLLGKNPPNIDWPHVFGRHYSRVEEHIVWCRALADTNLTAWVNAMDVFSDWLLIVLYKHDLSLGTYTKGNVGSILSSTRLKSIYPAIHAMIESIHFKRGESSLSHAWVKQGKKWTRPTGFVKHSYLRRAKKLIEDALKELAAKW